MYKISALTKRLFRYLKPYSILVIFSLILGLIFEISILYTPYVIGQEIINLFSISIFKISDLFFPLLKVGIATIIGAISGIAMGRLMNISTYRAIKDIRIELFNKLFKVPISYLDSKAHGDILTIVTTDVDFVWEGLLHGFLNVYRGIISIVITLVFMFISKWDIALLVVGLTPISVVISIFISKGAHKSYKEQVKLYGEMGGFANEMLTNQRTIIAYNLMDDNQQTYKAYNERYKIVGGKAGFVSSLVRPSTRFANAIIYAAVALFGTIRIVQEPQIMNVGLLSIFLFYASQYTRPFNQIADVASELSNSFASLKRVFQLLDEKEINKSETLNNFFIDKGEFKIDNVSFGYKQEKLILKNISFAALSGKKVAIVGPSGCGKTTIINLLMRFYEPNDGTISLDERHINKIPHELLRENVGMVLQDTWLFSGTVKENVMYSKTDATNDEIIDACKAAYAHEFIMKLPNGYDTLIDDNSGLSVGQKQLICIARVMLKLPKILILDEATSNIDSHTEINIQKAFAKLMKGRTSIVIAHRLSTIKNADLIIVLKDGKIIESGTHDELMKFKKFYYELYYSNNQAN